MKNNVMLPPNYILMHLIPMLLLVVCLQVEIVLMIMAISSEQIHLLLIIIKPSTI